MVHPAGAGTIDIDLNVFVGSEQTESVLAALEPEIVATAPQRAELCSAGQSRLWWDGTPVDVFLDTSPFHHDARDRIRWEAFGDAELPFLACRDLAVFKSFSDRTKDWVDLEEMAAAGTLDVDAVVGVLVRYLGGDDHRVARMLTLGG